MDGLVPDHVEREWRRRQDAEFLGWLRVCPDCGRTDLWLMEDGEWICHSCGFTQFPGAEVEL